jgi:hypothetical protein
MERDMELHKQAHELECRGSLSPLKEGGRKGRGATWSRRQSPMRPQTKPSQRERRGSNR